MNWFKIKKVVLSVLSKSTCIITLSLFYLPSKINQEKEVVLNNLQERALTRSPSQTLTSKIIINDILKKNMKK